MARVRTSRAALLTSFAIACHASEATPPLLAARLRILNPRGLAVYPCDIVERAEERRLRGKAAPSLALPRARTSACTTSSCTAKMKPPTGG
ncbi:hypothetical protein ACWCQZ_46160 [Streptomyces sp. NPDC002285]